MEDEITWNNKIKMNLYYLCIFSRVQSEVKIDRCSWTKDWGHTSITFIGNIWFISVSCVEPQRSTKQQVFCQCELWPTKNQCAPNLGKVSIWFNLYCPRWILNVNSLGVSPREQGGPFLKKHHVTPCFGHCFRPQDVEKRRICKPQMLTPGVFFVGSNWLPGWCFLGNRPINRRRSWRTQELWC